MCLRDEQDKKALINQANKLAAMAKQEKAERDAKIQVELNDVNDAIRALTEQINALRNFKDKERARLEAVKAERETLYARQLALQEELDGTAEMKRITQKMDEARESVSAAACMLASAVTHGTFEGRTG